MHVWNVLHAARWKYRTQNNRQKSPFWHHCKICPAISSQIRHVSTIGKKHVKQQYLLHMSHNMANFGLLAAEIGPEVCGTPANFNGFRVCPSLLQRRRSAEANQTLHDAWPCPELVHYIFFYTFSGALAPWLNFTRSKFTLRPSLAFSYIGSVTVRHSSSERKTNLVAWYKEWSYGTFAEGATYTRLGVHQVGHRPTF